MTIPANVAAFITEQRKVLDELEKFVETPEYRRLLAAAVPILVDEDPEPWLTQWLIEPAYGLQGRPLDVAARPGGVERVEQHLKWISNFVVG
ncbi:antitoxin Xre/MbcA/ParS toxin-binding domain-containing protein [Roseateles sp. P5_E4]